MEELSRQSAQLKQAYSRLSFMVRTFVDLCAHAPKTENGEGELITHRDALIQRFSFCYDLTWKFFKRVLRQHGIEANSPRTVFNECFKQRLITKDEMEMFLVLIDARNQTAHVYDESVADKVSRQIVTVYPQLQQIIDRF